MAPGSVVRNPMSAPSSIQPGTSTLFKPHLGGFQDIGMTFNWFAAVALLCGVASARLINVIGDIYLGELLLIQAGFLLLLLGKARPLTTFPTLCAFLQLAVLMLLGYMLSDIYRDARPAQ